MSFELSLNDFVRAAKKERFLTFLCVTVAVPFLILVFTIFQTWQATFSVNAQSGALEFNIGENLPVWVLETVEISVEGERAKMFNGLMRISKGAQVSLQTFANGPVYIHIQSAGVAPAELFTVKLEDTKTGEVTEVRESLEILLSDSVPKNGLVLPVLGQLIIGDVVHDQQTIDNPHLRSGAVKVFGTAFFSDRRFEALEAELEPGDQIQFVNTDNTSPLGYGFLNVSRDLAVSVQFHVEADYVSVSRFGSDGYRISPTLWNRLSEDPTLKILSLFFTTIIPIILTILLVSIRLADGRRNSTK